MRSSRNKNNLDAQTNDGKAPALLSVYWLLLLLLGQWIYLRCTYPLGTLCHRDFIYIYIYIAYVRTPSRKLLRSEDAQRELDAYIPQIHQTYAMNAISHKYIYIHFFNLRRDRKFNPCIFSRRFSPNPIPTQAQRKQPKTEVCVCLQYILMAIRQQRIGLLYIYLSPIFERHTHTYFFARKRILVEWLNIYIVWQSARLGQFNVG